MPMNPTRGHLTHGRKVWPFLEESLGHRKARPKYFLFPIRAVPGKDSSISLVVVDKGF